MAVGHVARDRGRYAVQSEPAALGGERRQKKDLEQEVPQLVSQRLRIPRVNGLERFVALLEEICPDGFGRLLAVPRAFPPQFLDEGRETGQRLRHSTIIFVATPG